MRASLGLGRVAAQGILLLFSSFASAWQVQPGDEALIRRGRDALALVREGRLDEFLALCDDTMREELPKEKLAQIWPSIIHTFGNYESETGRSVAPSGLYRVVVLNCKFSKQPLDVKLTFDGQTRISGFFIVPSSAGVPWNAPDYVDPSQFKEEEATVSAGRFPLKGFLCVPKSDKPAPGVVLVHGSGPNDADETILGNKIFKDLAHGLASRGIAVLRYNKRTLTYGGQMDPHAITIDTETVDDALAGARMLREDARVRPDAVFYLGHSLGAAAGPYAGEKEPKLAGLILMAAPARPIEDLLPEQIEYIAGADGVISAGEKKQLDETKAELAKLKSGRIEDSDMLLGVPAIYWKNLAVMATLEKAKSYAKPMLLLQGGRDYQVTMKDFSLFKEALKEHRNVTLVAFQKLDHLMRAGDGPSTPAEYAEPGHVDREVVETIAQWIGKTVSTASAQGK